MGEMNTTDSTAVLEAIHQSSLAKKGINPHLARETKRSCTTQERMWVARQPQAAATDSTSVRGNYTQEFPEVSFAGRLPPP